MTTTDKTYPLCSKLGVLRRVNMKNGRNHITISTTALHDKLGWATYRKFLPYMKHHGYSCVTPESCEKFLRTLNGKLTS